MVTVTLTVTVRATLRVTVIVTTSKENGKEIIIAIVNINWYNNENNRFSFFMLDFCGITS